MSLTQAKANTNTLLPMGNNGLRDLECTRDGALFTADMFLKLGLQGRIMVASFGSVTTPLTFLVTAANRPDWVIRVPSGTAIIPISVDITLEAAAGTATEIDIRICSNDIGIGTSTAATVLTSTRTDNPFTPATAGRHLYTADATAETTPVSVHRKTFPLAQASGLMDYSDFWRPEFGEIVVVGAGSFLGYIAATTTQATGFVVVKYAEVPASWVTG